MEVSLRRGVLWVCSYDQTVDGFWVMSEVTGPLDADMDDAALGRCVLAARRSSKIGVPTPSVAELSRPAPVVAAAGVKSYAQFIKGLRSVNITFDGTAAEITPLSNLGARGGLVPIVDLVRRVDPLDADEIGGTVRSALNVATA